MEHLYFAYGSNLDAMQMARRCPLARQIGPATLDEYRLGFTGHSRSWGGAVATVWREHGHQVPGLLWALDDDDLARLDRFEGHPVVYRRRQLWLDTGQPKRRQAEVYIKPAAQLSLPSPKYFNIIAHAYGRHGFDLGSLRAALEGYDHEL